MRNINMYKHLNADDKVSFSIPETVKTVESLNYGSQRFLSELVEYREAHENYNKYNSYQKYTQQLRELLEGDWY